VSNVEVMEWKKRAVINIDQFNTTVGNFGITSIEGLINGNIVLSTYNHVNLIDISKNYDKIGKKSLVECPIIDISKSVNYFTIKLEEVCKMTKEELIKISIESYDYYIEYMSPSVVAKFFETNLV
ncbi:MAG: hypothetical protein KC414_00170, partial [Romboutsia sp.]|nr:hypothetical protein [Romboutsia sp.]